jgi:hypothetical protein
MPLTAKELAALAEDAVALCQVLLKIVHPKAIQPTRDERRQIARMLRDFAIKLAIDVVD